MAEGLADQLANPGGFAELPFCDRLGLLVDQEADARDSRRLKMRLKVAKLRYPASIEDLDLRRPRGLDRSLVMERKTGPSSRDQEGRLGSLPRWGGSHESTTGNFEHRARHV